MMKRYRRILEAAYIISNDSSNSKKIQENMVKKTERAKLHDGRTTRWKGGVNHEQPVTEEHSATQ